MNLSMSQRAVLELYRQSERVTVADVSRELEIGEAHAAQTVQELADLGLLQGQRVRKLTENGAAVLEGRDVPVATPPPTERRASDDLPAKNQAESEDERRKMLSEILAERHHIDPKMLRSIIVSSVIHVGRGEDPPTSAEVFHVMSVMEAYRLDPWMKQLHAFRHKGKLQVMVGYDGWVRLANRRDDYLGVEYEYSDEMIETSDGLGKRSWEWIKCTVHSRGRLPTTVYCFLDEWYVPQRAQYAGPWQNQTRWRHRQKAFTLAVREHFGIALYDETDREQMEYHDAGYEDVTTRNMAEQARVASDQIRLDLQARSAAEAKEATDPQEQLTTTPEALGSLSPGDLQAKKPEGGEA